LKRLSELDKIHWLIIIGGPMGIYDYEKNPYLKEEKVFIKKAIDAKKTVLGICLGAQLIGDVLGAKISTNLEKEIGWFDIQETQLSNSLLVDLENRCTVFHWHGETLDIQTTDAERLAESEACKNQAYLYKEPVLGLQFHLEVTEQTLNEMVKNGNHELEEDKYVQSAEDILSNKQFIKTNNHIMFSLLDKLTKR
jgi:GMP synthase-like glutamine amidotransferase